MNKKLLEQKVEELLNNLSKVEVSNKYKAQAVSDIVQNLLDEEVLQNANKLIFLREV